MPRLFATLALLAACSKSDPGPACDRVVDHFLEVTKQGLTGHGKLELGNRKAMIDLCEQRHFSKTARRCLAEAKDVPGIATCHKLVAAESGAAVPGTPPPAAPAVATPHVDPAPTPAPAPAGSTGNGTPPP